MFHPSMRLGRCRRWNPSSTWWPRTPSSRSSAFPSTTSTGHRSTPSPSTRSGSHIYFELRAGERRDSEGFTAGCKKSSNNADFLRIWKQHSRFSDCSTTHLSVQISPSSLHCISYIFCPLYNIVDCIFCSYYCTWMISSLCNCQYYFISHVSFDWLF